MQNKPGNKRGGFSINELVIVIGIVVLLFGIAFVYYRNFISLKQLEEQSSKLANTLEDARKRAIVGDTSSSCQGEYLGHRVVLTTTRHVLWSHCSVSDVKIQDILYPQSQGIVSNFNGILDFKAKTGQVQATCIRLSRPDVERCRCIEITATGLISEGVCSSCGSCP